MTKRAKTNISTRTNSCSSSGKAPGPSEIHPPKGCYPPPLGGAYSAQLQTSKSAIPFILSTLVSYDVRAKTVSLCVTPTKLKSTPSPPLRLPSSPPLLANAPVDGTVLIVYDACRAWGGPTHLRRSSCWPGLSPDPHPTAHTTPTITTST